MDLILIRHGLPVTERRTDGSAADPGLSELGQRQARLLGALLSAEPIDAIYSSPMRRALQTAQPLSKQLGLEVALDDDLKEYDAGSDTYVPAEELERGDPQELKAAVERLRAFDAGDFQKTVVAAIERIVAANRGRTVAVTCHGGVINAWAGHVLGTQRVLFFQPDYTSIHRFRAATSGARSLVSLNERVHLHNDGLL